MNAGRAKRRYDTSITLVVTFGLGLIIGSTLTYALFGGHTAPAPEADTTPLMPLISTGPNSLPLPSAADLDGLWPARHLALGVADTTLSDNERMTFHEFCPGALLLRPENMETPAQTRALIDDARKAASEQGHAKALVLYAPPIDLIEVLFQASGVPTPEALGKDDDVDQARNAGHKLAEAMRPYGVEAMLLPLLDTFVSGRTPEKLRVNFLGSDPERVAALALALADGIGEGGILPVFGRYPGLGAVQSDVDGALLLNEDNIDLLATWMLPFQAAASHGMAGIVAAQAAVPALHPEDISLPAAFSPKLIRRTLREEWAFEGLVIADDLALLPPARRNDAERPFVEALAAGCDFAIVGNTTRDRVQERCKEVLRAVQAGQLPEEVLVTSKKRIAEFQSLVAKIQTPAPSAPEPPAPAPEPAAAPEPAPAPESTPAPPAPAETPPAAVEAPATAPDAPAASEAAPAPETAEAEPSPEAAPVAEESTPEAAPEAETAPEAAPESETSGKDPAAQPPGTTLIRHTIARGERLGTIAGKYGVSIDDLKAWNRLKDDNIKWGQTLKVYQKDEAAAAPDATTPASPETPAVEVEAEAESTPASSPTPAPAPEAGPEAPEAPRDEAPAPAAAEASTGRESAALPVAEPQPPNTDRRTHTVVEGDGMASIAHEYGVTEEELRRWNALPDGEPPTGTTLAVYLPVALPPDGGGEPHYDRHRIVSGDTLYRIAARYNTTPAELIKINQLKDPNDIRIGQSLKVPAKE